MAGHIALAVVGSASNAASDAMVDHTTLAIWSAITVVAGAIGAVVLFAKNILEIRKLKGEARKRDAEEREMRLRQAKMELEIEKLSVDAQERDAAKSRQVESERKIVIATHAERVRFGSPSQVGLDWSHAPHPAASPGRSAGYRPAIGVMAAGILVCSTLVGRYVFFQPPATLEPANGVQKSPHAASGASQSGSDAHAPRADDTAQGLPEQPVASGSGGNGNGSPDAEADAVETFRKGYEAYLAGNVHQGIVTMERADAMGAPGARARLCAIYRKPTAAEGQDFLKEANKCKGVE
jgi:hypothetical protein